jgi:hypothetical protein
MHEAQNRARSHLHAEQCGTACARGPTLFPTKLTEELMQPEGKASVGRSHLGKPLDEDVSWTVRVITVELAHMQMQDDLHILNRQIPDRALVAAMDTASGSATHRTEGGTGHSFTGEDQALGLPVERKQAETAQMRKKGMQ